MNRKKKNTIHHVFNIYNRLFDHIETETRQLKRKRVSWKIKLLKTLDAFNENLFHYYNQTQSGLGYFYGKQLFCGQIMGTQRSKTRIKKLKKVICHGRTFIGQRLKNVPELSKS